MSDNNASSRYVSYLLRVWRGRGHTSCRALLENVATGERVGFNTLADLIGFLETQIAENPEEAGGQQDRQLIL